MLHKKKNLRNFRLFRKPTWNSTISQQQVSPVEDVTTKSLCERLHDDPSMKELQLSTINDGHHAVDISSLTTKSIDMLSNALYQNTSLQTVFFDEYRHDNNANNNNNNTSNNIVEDKLSSFSKVLKALSVIPTLKHVVVTNMKILQDISFQQFMMTTHSSTSQRRSLRITTTPSSKKGGGGDGGQSNNIPTLPMILLDSPSPDTTTTMIRTITPCVSYLSSLSFQKCGIGNGEVIALANVMKQHPHLQLDNLSLAGNPDISGQGFKLLLSTGGYKIRRLDLTNCDISMSGFRALVNGIKKIGGISSSTYCHKEENDASSGTQETESSSPSSSLSGEVIGATSTTTTICSGGLQALDLAYNRKLVPSGILSELLQCFMGRKLLDISHCNVTPNDLTTVIFPVLEDESCQLESLLVNGCPAPGRELGTMLKHNTSLKHLHIDHPSEADITTKRHIIEGLEANETLKTFAVYNKLLHRTTHKNNNNKDTTSSKVSIPRE